MKRFDYEAKDQSTGKMVKASVQADTERSAAKLLFEQGFTPHSIKEVGEDTGSVLSKITNHITLKDRVVFTRQLSTLIGAGLPLTQSLRTVRDQTENKRLQGVVDDIIANVEGGKSLSESFGQHPKVFNNVFLALITAGEASGTLDDSLKRIAAQQEKDAAMISKIRGAMVYPAIVLLVIMGVVIFMLVAVVPQVKNLYKDLNQELPLITEVMVTIADGIINFWWAVLIVAVAIIFFTRQYLATEQGIKAKDTFKLNVPIFGRMFRKLYMARFARTGQTLLNTGVPMLDMLRITSQAVNNVVIGSAITRSSEKVKGGKALSASLKPEEYIAPFVPQMISIGEQSGKIDEMMGKTAQVYEDELDEEVKSISTAIEPILMVILAVVAGTLVAAILLPIYGLVNNISI